jgi:threo-3-hydroxy-D-aspartate ammonia-lyase
MTVAAPAASTDSMDGVTVLGVHPVPDLGPMTAHAAPPHRCGSELLLSIWRQNEDMNAALEPLNTPAALIDLGRMQRNIALMQTRARQLGVALRPHVKTSKCREVTAAQIAAGAHGITVSTLKEAEQFHAQGINNILYAVGMVSSKLPQALDLRRKGCQLQLLTDSLQGARAIADFGRAQGEVFEVLIEIDTDGHRSGIRPEDAALIDVGRAVHDGGMALAGVMTHAGASYELHTPEALQAIAEQERAGCVRAAERLRAAGLPCPVVSVGSTPTALSAQHLAGVTELRAGVYVFFDLVMTNVGVCQTDDIALPSSMPAGWP